MQILVDLPVERVGQELVHFRFVTVGHLRNLWSSLSFCEGFSKSYRFP